MAGSKGITKIQAALKAADSRVAKIKEHNKDIGEKIQAAAVGTAAATVLGMLDGYDEDGGMEVFGVPLTLAAGVAGHGIGVVTGNRVFHDAGNGALAAFGYTWGRGAGEEFREKREAEGSKEGDVSAGSDPSSRARDVGRGSTDDARVRSAWVDGRSRERATRRRA